MLLYGHERGQTPALVADLARELLLIEAHRGTDLAEPGALVVNLELCNHCLRFEVRPFVPWRLLPVARAKTASKHQWAARSGPQRAAIDGRRYAVRDSWCENGSARRSVGD